MNKKGKNKKGKVPNPSSAQEEKSGDQVEELEKSAYKIKDVGDIIKNLEENLESVKEERVPEIISEIITTPVETKDEETPKKPKRSRGKKKKGKDDELNDNLHEKLKETDNQLPLEETKVHISNIESKIDELPEITPTARKKKSKKQTVEEKTEESLMKDEDLLHISKETETKELLIKESATDIKDLKSEEQEVKPSKKKSKKKKRNDSEKSDKEEFSCTTAFQKILDDKEESNKKQKEEKVERSVTPIATAKVDNTEIKLEQEKVNTPVQQIIEKSPSPIKEEKNIKETLTAENRSNKKNKKDKKLNISKHEESPKHEEPSIEQSSTITNIEATSQSIDLEQTKIVADNQEEVAVAVIETSYPLIEDLSPKPKAKIARPVEKKRKEKHEAPTVESIHQDVSISEPQNVEKEPIQLNLENSETKAVDHGKLSDIISKTATADIDIFSDIILKAVDTPSEDEKLYAQEFELIAEKAMGKKKKKATKMPKSLELSSDTQGQKIDTESEKTDVKIEQLPVITEILTPQADQQEFIIMSQKCDVPIRIDTVTEIKDIVESIKQTGFQGKILLTPENITEEREFIQLDETTTQLTEDKNKTETKSGKKRKKSPKPQKKTEITETKEIKTVTKTEDTIKESSKLEAITQQSLAEKVEPSNITRMYDIEISSIKAEESEGSACDVVPDITYPRAASQQLLDNNNNTVIREIFPLEASLSDASIVQELTDMPKMETIIKETEVSRVAPREEKTDLKSKMMEVNQDMEELRLSIERSLAELTSMEKSEDTIEKKFEASKVKLEFGESTAENKPSVKEKVIENITLDTTIIGTPFIETKTTAVTKDGERQKNEEILQNLGKSIDVQSQVMVKQKDELPTVGSKPDSKTLLPSSKVENKPLEISPTDITCGSSKALIEKQKIVESSTSPSSLPKVEGQRTEKIETEKKTVEESAKNQIIEKPIDVPPVCPARKDNKGKHKKKKGKQDAQLTTATPSTLTATQSQSTQESKKEDKTESKTESKTDSTDKSESKTKGKQQASKLKLNLDETSSDKDCEPIENFEDALTSSADDVNKTFEIIVKESQEQNNPKINIIAPDEDKTPVSPPKNLLGHPDIPVRSNRRDYKKEKDKIPNEITAKVKIKDSTEVERKQSKNTQTVNKLKDFSKDYKINENEDFVYKYSFRKVFLQSSCHVCKKVLSGSRVPCGYCNLLFYCSNKHKDEDWPQHQALCFAISTIVHLKDQKHIYADAKNLTGHDYRLIRMQMIVSCEKVLKRRLVPWEQEALLYPRICAHVPCREWRQGKLSDCQGCGQISFCTNNADHFPKSHSRWCKSYALYEKLVCYQQTTGRLEPKMPTKVFQEQQQIPEKINEVLASMYEEKLDINDIQYAALTQLATAPLTAVYCHQLCKAKVGSAANGLNKKSMFTVHVVGAELQFEADALNKWEVFFLHLRPDLQELRVVLINDNLNPSNLPLELLGKIKLCENCRQNKRRVLFSFQDKRTYTDYKSSEDFVYPDIVCAFNASIQKSSVYNGKDPWPSTINIILKLKVPFIVTGYTITELQKDCIRIKECSETGYNLIAEPKYNNFASVRPDRNFISDDDMPLLFKNYCFAIVSG